ncbi:4'-phosphopantetheinyl transferase superfamily protein [Lacihabitans sp. LS3-19]|uniref:4'-phosphopantetheinyl transferase family protein n=1 Tax=Lacihabitans sp. LS3-19 TaxID=2487335 RepID=UPI0020CF9D31|nr:4'-phosphopantetheinyl transferase superfamily protein [Lacihabitans sp. LS3-19]
MALLFNKILSPEIHYMVWHLTETTEELWQMVNPDEADLSILEAINHDAKKREYLAGKNAIMKMCESQGLPFLGIYKDEHGKPFLKDNPFEISLTHTLEYIGVVFSKKCPVGIDIEKPRPQIMRILKRLFSEAEVEEVNENVDKATIYWSAKEALYKLYGKRKVDFKENLFLENIEGYILGKIKMPDHEAEHHIFVEKLFDYFLVIAY